MFFRIPVLNYKVKTFLMLMYKHIHILDYRKNTISTPYFSRANIKDVKSQATTSIVYG